MSTSTEIWWLQGMRTVGPHVASKFCEIVKLRNRLARNLGYEDFYDYKVRQEVT